MIKLSNIIVLGGIATFVAWSANAAHQGEVAARAKAVATYSLTPEQASVYDGCLGALTDKVLKKGGSKQSFCGCFASTAAADENGIKYSVDILKRVADRNLGDNLRRSQDTGYLLTFMTTTKAAVTCAREQQNIFSSKEEIATWCAARPERAAGEICQHRPL